MNVEPPQVKPLAEGVFLSSAVGVNPSVERRLLFACNTPNDMVEVYDLGAPDAAQSSSPRLVGEIPVGATPVSVLPARFVPGGATGAGEINAVFTANFLGDSVTYLTFNFVVSNAGVVTAFATWPVGTLEVGDEPMDIALLDSTPDDPDDVPFLYVAKRTRSSYAILNARPAGFRVVEPDVRMVVDAGGVSQQFPTRALKEPHRVLVHPNRDELWILGHQGGNGDDMLFQVGANPIGTIDPFDFDICVVDLTDPTSTTPPMVIVEGLGSTNHGMAFNEAGDSLYVVGMSARVGGADALEGNEALVEAETGFVRTMMWRVDSSQFPTANPTVESWDMNLASGVGDPVDRTDSLAHLTDVVVRDGGALNDLVWVSAFHSDNFARLEVSKLGPDINSEERVHLWEGADPPRIGLRGPRSIAVAGATEDVIVLNRVEGGLAWLTREAPGQYAFDAADDVVAMGATREPAYMTAGREFLYSTRFSGNGFVSCSSCHVDGRSDQQAWLLTPEPGLVFPYDLDEVGLDIDPEPGLLFPEQKGHMVTQSFQGLANFEMNHTRMPAPPAYTPAGPEREFNLVSNAPFHWRADKPTFLDFNEAFVGLQGMEPDNGGGLGPYEAAGDGVGLTTEEMSAFEEFIMSIHYGPNPLQEIDRDYGDNAAEGLRGFFVESAFFDLGRSCATCHSLPEGSNNRIVSQPPVQRVPENGDPLNIVGTRQPLEVAALRGILQKEGVLEADFFQTQCLDTGQVKSNTRSGDVGLSRQGFLGQAGQQFDTLSFRDFMIRNCDGARGEGTAEENAELDERVTEFTYKIDHGVAPIVGHAFTLRQQGPDVVVLGNPNAVVADLLDLWAGEADEGNCDLVATFSAWRLSAGNSEAFVYNVATGLFVDESGGEFNRGQLLALLASDPPGGLPGSTPFFNRLTIEALPLGTGPSKVGIERPVFDGPTYFSPEQRGSVPNEAYRDVPTFGITDAGDPDDSLLGRTRELLREGAAAIPGSGVDANTFDAPRRLQFVAQGGEFLPGTVIELYLHHQEDITTPLGLPEDCVREEICATRLELPIFPIGRTLEGQTIWETAIELEPEVLHSLMLGGPFAPAVSEAWADPNLNLPPFESADWGSYWWRAVYPQPDGSGSVASDFVLAPILYPDI